MTCNECENAKGCDIKMCEVFRAPCFDKYMGIDKCGENGCRHFTHISGKEEEKDGLNSSDQIQNESR